MTDERFDLSPLRPDDTRFERMTRNITERARFELARRAAAQQQTVFEMVAGWAKPALLAAASIAGVSLALLTVFDRSQAEAATAYMPATELPATASDWYEEGREPTVDELLVAGNQGEGQ
jgi:anti-sigma-K factor RskA